MTTTFDPDPDLLSEQRCWLSAFDARHGRKWENLLRADMEAAMSEAAVRRLLEQNGNLVEPNEDLTGAKQSPDFRCTQARQTFFVEVTCLSVEAVTPLLRAGHYVDLTERFFNKCRTKTPQCANMQYPSLVAMATVEPAASSMWFGQDEAAKLLTGEPILTIDPHTGESRLITHLQNSAFMTWERTTGEVIPARSSVSGVLLCGFGVEPFQVRCVMHPSPVRPFDRSLLPGVEFCRLKDGYKAGKLEIEQF